MNRRSFPESSFTFCASAGYRVSISLSNACRFEASELKLFCPSVCRASAVGRHHLHAHRTPPASSSSSSAATLSTPISPGSVGPDVLIKLAQPRPHRTRRIESPCQHIRRLQPIARDAHHRRLIAPNAPMRIQPSRHRRSHAARSLRKDALTSPPSSWMPETTSTSLTSSA